MSKSVWVVTSVELGWDCVVGVFDPDKVTEVELEEKFPDQWGYVIHHNILEDNLEAYD